MSEVHQIFATAKYTVTALVAFGGEGLLGGDGRRCCAGEVRVAVRPCGCEGHKLGFVHAGDGLDPLLVLGHAGEAAGAVGSGAAVAKTHNSVLDPPTKLLVHQGPARVSLREETVYLYLTVCKPPINYSRVD